MGGSSTTEAVDETVVRAPHLSPEKPGRALAPLTAVLCGVLALATGLAVAALLRSTAPVATSHPMSGRLGYYLQHPEEFDTLFIGSSRVFRGVVPRVFDERMAQLGRPTRSLNLGEPGMRSYEVDRVARLVLANNDGHLATLVLGPGVRSPKTEQETHRSVEWHTARQTLAALRTTGDLDVERSAYWGLVGTHLRQFAMRQSNYGTGRDLWGRVGWRPEKAPAWLGRGGYKSLESESRGLFRRRRKQFLESQDNYQRTVERYRRTASTTVPPETVLRLERWRAQARLAGDIGVQAVALLAPGYGRMGGVSGEGLVLLNFDDPQRYPDLFDPSSRFDAVHLNDETAKRYSVLVAEALVEQLDPGEGR